MNHGLINVNKRFEVVDEMMPSPLDAILWHYLISILSGVFRIGSSHLIFEFLALEKGLNKL